VSWHPVSGHIMTRWADQVTPRTPWSSYPRPQMVRPQWHNLNGLWAYGITPRTVSSPRFQGEILVPYPIESALSGVKQPLLPDQRLWYRRHFQIPAAWRGQRVLLHFGAVDWETTVWINDRLVGTHRGGYLPFHFDISEHVRSGKNDLIAAVWDPTDSHWQARGKQALKPEGIWYTAVSGIWQTVWLEGVPATHVERLRLTPDIDAGVLRAEVFLAGEEGGEIVSLTVWDGWRKVAQSKGGPGKPIVLSIPDVKLWSPEHPHLYGLQVRILRHDRMLDEVKSYFGMRKFSLEPDQQGRPRLCLNHRPLFHYGPLDQGYWPDGLYTAPTEEAMRSDIDAVKAAGCNMLRKHVKVEPAQFYAYCDRKGIIVWQDMPNGGGELGDWMSTLTSWLGRRPKKKDRDYKKVGRADPEARADFRQELREMVDFLYNAPSVGMWVPFNEGWGQFDAGDIAEWLKRYDPTRPVDHASGWFDQGGGDFLSIHCYAKRLKREPPEEKRAVILSEFGGYSLTVPGHVWDATRHYGYSKLQTSEDLLRTYESVLMEQVRPWTVQGLSGAVYTQIVDVETELNGWFTYDRAVAKLPPQVLRDVHRRAFTVPRQALARPNGRG